MDSAVAARIAQVVTADLAGARVVEIGPGTGRLTQALLATGAHVTAVDIDPDMVRILRAQDDLNGAHIVQADALTFDYESFGAHPWRMAGNLPYNIATPLIMRLISMNAAPDMLVVMVQKEVAQRFTARPGTAAYGSLTVALQYAMHVETLFNVKAAAFYPRPKIDSSVVRLTRRSTPAVCVADEKRFLQVVRAAFAYRRKTLANSLALALGVQRGAVTQALQHLGLDTEIRGEQLSIADFARLADRLPA